MKIVHVVDYLMPQIGYQEFFLPKWNAMHGHDTVIVCADRYTPIPDYETIWGPLLGPRICGPGEETISGVNIVRLPTKEINRRPFLRELKNTLDVLDPEIVWMHGTASPSSFRVASWSKRTKVPVIMDNHQCFVAARGGIAGGLYYQGLRWLSGMMLSGSVKKFVGVAEECCRFMTEVQGLPKEKMVLIPLGVDTDLFRPRDQDGERVRQKLGIPGDALLIMQTGKLDPSRRPDLLVEALTPWMNENTAIWLLFLGGIGSLQLEALNQQIAETGIKDRTLFHPMVLQTELPPFFNAADLCVYPDSSSLSSLEAGACECVVVMNDLPACAERVENGVGINFKRGNSDSLRDILGDLIKDPKKREELGKKARQSVLEKYSYDKIALNAEKLMRKIRDDSQ